MSPDDTESNLPKPGPTAGDGSEDLLASLTPEPLELKPIQPEHRKAGSSENSEDSSGGKKRRRKVHAPDPKTRPLVPELPLTDEPGIGELPDLPNLRPEPVPLDEEAVAELERLSVEEEAAENEEEGVADAPPAGGDAPLESAGMGSEDAPGTVASSDPGPGGGPASPENAIPAPVNLLPLPDAVERKWLIILLAGLLVIGGCVYFLLRSALPTDSGQQARMKPNLPIQGENVTIEALEMDWKDEGSDSLAGGMKSSTLMPRVSLRFGPGGSGAVRIFFRNERGQLVGDTVDLEPAAGILEHIVTCTAGLRSRLEYDVLRAQDAARWTLEIYEGPKKGGPLVEFKLLSRLAIPWNLDQKSSP